MSTMTETGTTTAVIIETVVFGVTGYQARCQCGWKSEVLDREAQALAANKRHAEKAHAE